MYFGKLNKTDIANGTGVRVSLFVSGCTHYCKGCFNPETWNFEYGQPFTEDTVTEILDALAPEHIDGLTVLGGEPLHDKNYLEVMSLLARVKKEYPTKSIWVYTGGRYEDYKDSFIMRFIDVLVDGAFVESKKDITLRFRGSSNQRIINVPASLSTGLVVSMML